MSTKSYIFAGIIAAISATNAFATGENTVTSKSYVDAQDALKQDKITSKTTGNVVTYNGTDANGQTQFDELGFLNMDNEAHGEWIEYNNTGDYYQYDLAEGHENDIINAGTFVDTTNSIFLDLGNMYGTIGTVVVRGDSGMPSESRNIYDGSTTYNASTDANSLATASFVETKANHMTCAGWPDGAAHTDANCWLWNKN